MSHTRPQLHISNVKETIGHLSVNFKELVSVEIHDKTVTFNLHNENGDRLAYHTVFKEGIADTQPHILLTVILQEFRSQLS